MSSLFNNILFLPRLINLLIVKITLLINQNLILLSTHVKFRDFNILYNLDYSFLEFLHFVVSWHESNLVLGEDYRKRTGVQFVVLNTFDVPLKLKDLHVEVRSVDK
jgi:hypothetical protein